MEAATPKQAPTGLIVAGAVTLIILVILVLIFVNRGGQTATIKGTPAPIQSAPSPKTPEKGPPSSPAVNYDDIMAKSDNPLIQTIVGKYW